MPDLDIQGTNVLERNLAATTRFVVNQGGTRSSKTTSILQLLIIEALKGPPRVFSIVRKTMPSLRGSAMRDFFGLLEEYGLYDERNHNKSDEIYRLNGTEIEFFGLDQPQKVRGRERAILFLNEANEFTYEDFMQLNLRTTVRVFMDYNPSDEHHWIYDRVIPRQDCTFIKSTYLDALAFLPKDLIAEIERLKSEDPDYWTVYGLGDIGRRKSIIYSHYRLCDDFDFSTADEVVYGLDFGFNHPTALIRVGFKDDVPYVSQAIYQSGLTNTDLMRLMDEVITEGYAPIFADCEDPNRIEEIARYERVNGSRFNIFPVEKGKDSVRHGIDVVKTSHMCILKDSEDVIREIRKYSWKTDKSGNTLDEPVKIDDDAMDAMRYAIQSVKKPAAFTVLFEA